MSGAIAVFLDRDGTLNVEVDYLRSPDQLKLYPGAGSAVRRLNDAGFITCVISNQSGVARGFLTEDHLTTIHAKLRAELAHDEARLDQIYYCPHHPTAGLDPYKIDCECRKPKTGMLQAAQREFSIDLQQSFLVGDSLVDMQAAMTAGVAPILVQTGYGKKTMEECIEQNIVLCFVAETLVDATAFIIQTVEGRTRAHE
jgi:D-glycero-D-manno-heptose 1,7-bisphosphate phosphatase